MLNHVRFPSAAPLTGVTVHEGTAIDAEQ